MKPGMLLPLAVFLVFLPAFAATVGCGGGGDDHDDAGAPDDDTASDDDTQMSDDDSAADDDADDDDDTEPDDDADDDDTVFTVLSFNTLHGIRDEDPDAPDFDRFPERLDILTSELLRLEPDAVMLQEIFATPILGYPDTIAHLAAALPEYAHFFGNVFGFPPDPAGGLLEGRLTMTSRGVLGDASNRPVWLFRTVLHVRVSSPFGPVDLYNAHLEGPGEDAQARAEMQNVLDFIGETAGDGNPVILAGDFNSRDTEAPAQMLRDAGFTDLADASGLVCAPPDDQSGCTSDTMPLGEAGNRTAKRIDYLWLRADPEPAFDCVLAFGEPFEVAPGDFLWASDHIGLYCELFAEP
ncbi:MAG: endonuclease/exonuclease/phosphatase family protein [Deltaproteobacteria bacterium]|nr:endonuclease/exonuclease/phosphatase family protein [Deltaproteobacteria bacterium]